MQEETSQAKDEEKKEFRSVLLLKLPYCTHPSSLYIDNDFKTKSTFRPVPSLAIATLCAFVEKYKKLDYNIKAIDLNIEAYTKPGEQIDTSRYIKILEQAINDNNYDVLCLSATFVFNEKWVKSAVEMSNKLHPKAKIIVGGGYPTLFPERCLNIEGVDDVVIGEGESTFLHILNKYNNYKDEEFENKFSFAGYGKIDKEGNIEVIRKKSSDFIDMADLPVPAWHVLDIQKYFNNSGDRTLPIEATRGCPFCCSFCDTYLSWGYKVRYKPLQKMLKELVEINDRYNIDCLHFVDDNLTFSKEWIVGFLKEIMQKDLPFKIIASNFSVRCLDEEIIDLLVKAEFKSFGIAVETGCPEMQKRINKKLDFEHVRKMVKIIKSYKKVHLHINWMVGFPNETMEQIETTFNFARELKANSNQFMTVLPYPGTKLFDEAKRDNLLIFDEKELDKYDNRKCDYLKSDEWNYEQLQQMIYDINIETNFLNNPTLESEDEKEEFREYLKQLIDKLPEHVIANIIVGYLWKDKDQEKYKFYYEKAKELLNKENLKNTFIRYLSWNNKIIKDYNEYINCLK